MPLIATENKRLTNVLKSEFWPEQAYCRETVTVNEAAAKSYVPGTVLGKVTATGKYKIAVQTAVDGSQTAAAIVMGEVAVPATTDTKVLVLVRGPAIVSKSGLVLDATYDLQAELDAVYASLLALDIQVRDAV
jgi:hypothetical protein